MRQFFVTFSFYLSMKVSNLEIVHANFQTPSFKSKRVTPVVQQGHDTFASTKKNNSNHTAWWIVGSLAVAGIGALVAHKAGWFKKVVKETENKIDDILQIEKFTKVDEAKEYFEKLGIETDFRGVSDEHLGMLNRIKKNLEQLKEMGVKKEKPDSITISDWKNREELSELHRKYGRELTDYMPEYLAECIKPKESDKIHILINSNKPEFDMFRHEMGHANDFLKDSFIHVKGISGHDFADKQLEILGEDIKIYRGTKDFDSIFYFHPNETTVKYAFPNQNMESRYVYINDMLSKMQAETGCYAPDKLIEQKAYIFEGLLEGKQFSDEVMLYYDFSGGARIPNLKINGMTYDEYMESIYNKPELIQKLRENIKIRKI